MANLNKLHAAYRDLLEALPNGFKWRKCATDHIIKLNEERRFNKWLLGGLYALDIAIIGMLIKMVLGV